MKLASIRHFLFAAFCGVTVVAVSLPVHAAPDEHQRYIIRKAAEEKREKARQAALQDKQELKQAEECAKPEDGSTHAEGKNAS